MRWPEALSIATQVQQKSWDKVGFAAIWELNFLSVMGLWLAVSERRLLPVDLYAVSFDETSG